MRTLLIAGLISLTSHPAAAAAPTLQPGLYEISVEMVLKGMPMQMPVSTFRHCISAQDIIDGGAYASSENSNDCRVSNFRQTANTLSYDFSCTLPGSGTMSGRASGTQHAAGYAIMMNGSFDPPQEGMREFGQKLRAKRLGGCS